jgi:hypothetical protein
MWRSCLAVLCMAVSVLLALAVPSMGAARAGASSYLNPALVQIGQVPGQIIDVSGARILYLGSTLKVLDRATRQTVTVPAGPGHDPGYGWLVPGGVIFRASGGDSTTVRLYEWCGGSHVNDLGPLNSTFSVVVRAPYVIWSDGTTLYRRDLATGRTVVVATDAGNWYNDLLPTGEVIYWTDNGSYRIMRYYEGKTEQVGPGTPGLWNVYPITDGTNVVYLRLTPCCGNQDYSIILNHGTRETALTAPASYEPSPGRDYEVAGGWTAFQETSGAGDVQTWLRDPGGTVTRLPDIAPRGSPGIVAMNAAGQVMYSSGENLYLGQSGKPAVLLASGQGAWGTRRFASMGKFATYLCHRWYLAIGGSLYVLSHRALATLNAGVQGHGINHPYGASCRSRLALWPAERVEHGDGVEVVPPVHDFPAAEGENGDELVAVRVAGGDSVSVAGIFEYRDALGRVVVDGQVGAVVNDHEGAVGTVEFGDRGAARDARRVAGNGHHILGDDVVGEELEEVAGPGQAVQSLLDDAEERVERGEVRKIRDGGLHDVTSPSRRRRPGRRTRRS